MKAKLACEFAVAMAQRKFSDDVKKMAPYCLEWLNFMMVDGMSYGSNKYIPTQDLNDELGLPTGAGIYAYYKFEDGSYALLTCSDGLAVWSGGEESPEFIEI